MAIPAAIIADLTRASPCGIVAMTGFDKRHRGAGRKIKSADHND